MLSPDSTSFRALIDYVLAIGSELLEAQKRETDAFDAFYATDDDETLYAAHTQAARRRRAVMHSFDSAMYLLRGECTSAVDHVAVYDALRERGAHDVARLVEFR